MADEDFLIFYMLGKKGATLHIPPKARRGQKQFTADDNVKTSRVANLRIHVERAFARVKQFKYLSNRVKLTSVDMTAPVFYVAAMLTLVGEASSTTSK